MALSPTPVTVTWDATNGWQMFQPTAPATGVQAYRIADLLERFGVNTFSSTSATSNVWGSWPADYSQQSVIVALNWLTGASGLKIQIREYHYAGRRSWQEPWCQAVHAATGSVFSVAIGAGGGVTDANSIVAMAATSASGTGWLKQVEGINEPNNDFGSGAVPVTTVISVQQALALAPSGVAVAGPSVVFGLPTPEGYITPAYLSSAQLALIKAASSVANGHLYPPDEVDQTDGSTRGGIMRDTVQGLTTVYGQPITLTEWHPTLYGSHGHNLDPAYDAYYAACFFLSAFREGIVSWFWYSLLDYGTAYLSGLFPQTGGVNPRAAANTIQAMFTLTGDVGSTKRTFQAGKLDYTVTGLATAAMPNAGGHHMLFQNSAGAFFLFVWNAVSTPGGPTAPVIVTFAKPVARVQDFNVTDIVAPKNIVQDVTNASSITIPLNGSVHLLRITV